MPRSLVPVHYRLIWSDKVSNVACVQSDFYFLMSVDIATNLNKVPWKPFFVDGWCSGVCVEHVSQRLLFCEQTLSVVDAVHVRRRCIHSSAAKNQCFLLWVVSIGLLLHFNFSLPALDITVHTRVVITDMLPHVCLNFVKTSSSWWLLIHLAKIGTFM